jgi:hypothetical protein
MNRRLRAVAAGRVAVGAAMLAAGLCPAAAQQTPTPSPAPAPPPPQIVVPRPWPNDEINRRWQFDAAQKLHDQADLSKRYRQSVSFAECAQRVSPSRLANLLEQPLASPGERRAANTLIRFAPGCLGNSVLVSTRLLRGAAAEAALEGFRLADPDQATTINSARMDDFLEATPALEREKDETAVALTKLTQCQVLFAPGLARKVLDAEPDTEEETDIRARLAEGTTMCGRVDARSHFAWLIHRSYLAEALYHWTRSGGSSSRS